MVYMLLKSICHTWMPECVISYSLMLLVVTLYDGGGGGDDGDGGMMCMFIS